MLFSVYKNHALKNIFNQKCTNRKVISAKLATRAQSSSLHYRLAVVLREFQLHNVRLDTGIIPSFSTLKV